MQASIGATIFGHLIEVFYLFDVLPLLLQLHMSWSGAVAVALGPSNHTYSITIPQL